MTDNMFLGNFLPVKVHAGNLHGIEAGWRVFEEAVEKHQALKGVCADAGYCKRVEKFVQEVLRRPIEISELIAPEWALLFIVRENICVA